MAWVKIILDIILALGSAIPILHKWFSKSPTEKVLDKKKAIRKAFKKARKTGRPQW